jgi:ferredoxin-NADP reductase
MEWTLGHPDPDSRGNRRYFTLASSPTEDTLRLGVKFYPESSSFKESMLGMDHDREIVASQLAGDFTLPRNPKQACVFIAGGIGITPFRSMIKYLIDRRQPRPIVLFYANRLVSDIVYRDVFDEAQRKLGIQTIYTLTDTRRVPVGWTGEVGRINARLISRYVPDYRHCLFYLSGPNAMVTAYEETLLGMGVGRGQIKKDFFPGFA